MNCPGFRTLIAAGLALAGCADAWAQDAAVAARRKPTFVRVVDAAGDPVVGAVVTFAGSSPHFGADVLPVDLQEVLSDTRGRARARLRPGLCYVAWASGEVNEQAEQAISEPHGFFGAGAMFELSCRQRAVNVLELAGLEAWADLGPLRYYLVTQHPGKEIELEAAADGRFRLPAITQAVFEVRTAKDSPLWSVRVQPTLSVPPPREVRVRAVDKNGVPVAGARIRHRVARRSTWLFDGIRGIVQARMREVGITGADGRATVTVPYGSDPLQKPGVAEMMLFADAPGRAIVAGGTYGRRIYVDDHRVEKFEAEELVFTLPKVDRIEARPRIVPVGTVGQLVAVCKLRSGGNSYMHDPRVFTTTVGSDGVLAFDNVPADVHSMRVSLLLPDGPVSCAFAGLSGRTFPPELVTKRAGLLADRVGQVRLRALDVTGGPANGAVVCVVPAKGRGILQRDSMFRFPLDSAGSGSIYLGPGKWVAVVITAEGYSATEFELDARPLDLELKMEPLATMRIVLHDEEGKPVVGARLRLSGSRTRATRDPRQSVMRLFSRQMRQHWDTLQTDEEGALTVPFLPVDGVDWTMLLSWSGGATDKFIIEANDEPLQLHPK